MPEATPTRHLDVTGTFCPLPILLAVREMLRLAPGDRLEIVGDDPAILEDMPVWCERAGHRLLRITHEEGRVTSLVEKGEPRPLGPRRPADPGPRKPARRKRARVKVQDRR